MRDDYLADELINPLVKLVQERLPWLFSEHGFKIIDYSYDRTGDCQVNLESEQLRISFVRGRSFSQAYLAARSDPTKSYELGFLMLALADERPDIGFEGNAALLKDNWALLLSALGPKLAQTKNEYERRELESKTSLERVRAAHGMPSVRHFSKLHGTPSGRIVLLLLRLAGAALFVWALYAIFRNHPLRM